MLLFLYTKHDFVIFFIFLSFVKVKKEKKTNPKLRLI